MIIVIAIIITIVVKDVDDDDLFQVQGMWDIQVVKDTAGCLDRVSPFTHSQITGDEGEEFNICNSFSFSFSGFISSIGDLVTE